MNETKNKKVFTVLKIIGMIFLFLFVFAFLFVGFAIVFMMSNWSNLSLFELIMQLKSLSGTTTESVMNFLVAVALPSLLITVSLLAGFFLLRRFFRKSAKKRKVVLSSFLSLSLIGSLSFFVPEAVFAYDYLDVGGYLENSKKDSEFIDQYYVDPNDVSISFPEKKRNLILIYLESMEITYSDQDHGGYFESNYIPELTELALENECFSDGTQLNGSTSMLYTNWTMAGLFSTSTGLPFKTSLGQNNMDTQETFFPNVMALGDILNHQGYDQTFLCGSDSSFAGRSLYYKSHGNFDIHDFYTYYYKYGVQVENQWGFMDYHLFQYAKEEVKEKASAYDSSMVPFNYEMLTVDTHFHIGSNDGTPDGFLCQYCPADYGDDQYANVINCSSRQASEFVSWFYGKDGNQDISENARENTTIVLMGDHPTMSTYFCNAPSQAGFERRTYVCFVNSAKERKEKKMRKYCHFDLFPTILSSIGADISGNRLALGVDLYSGYPSYLELFEKDYINMQLQGKSEVIDSLLKVNPYEYNYLKRIGRLPTAKGNYKEEEKDYVFSISGLDKHGLDENLSSPMLVLGKNNGETVSYPMEETLLGYQVRIEKEEVLNQEFTSAKFTIVGDTSQNTYVLDTITDLQDIFESD